MAGDEYAVHDVKTSQTVSLASGKIGQVTHLEFYIGAHGPFLYDFPAGQDSDAQVQQYIRSKVAWVRSIAGGSY